MLHCGQPGVAVVGGRGAIKLDPLGVHVHAQERHVVFPADHGTEPADGGLKDWHRRAVSLPPRDPFGRGGHQLAMLAHQMAVRSKEENRAVERAPATLDHADDQIGPGRFCRGSQKVRGRTRHVN